MSGPHRTDPFAWTPPEGWVRIRTVDAHAEGEPLRVVLAGYPELRGDSVLARRRHARESLDALRTALMWEPRGHADMYGCILTPAVSEEADFGVVFAHNEGYSTMCGHGIIALTRVILDLGLVEATGSEATVAFDTPAGVVRARARLEDGSVESVSFRNVASWVQSLDGGVDVPGLGRVRYDLAFGGAFYAYVQAADVGLPLVPSGLGRLVDAGMAIKRAVQSKEAPSHPDHPDLSFLYGTIFVGPAANRPHHSRNVCVFAEGEVDRSPTGTGVSGRLAIHRARGEVEVGEPLIIESIVGTHFTCTVVEDAEAHGRDAVVPEVEGRAWITGRSEFFLDPDDPFRHGFLVR